MEIGECRRRVVEIERKFKHVGIVGKYTVKDNVVEKISREYIIPLVGVQNRFEDIDFTLLPNQFVLKCTHDSGSVIICRNKQEFDFI